MKKQPKQLAVDNFLCSLDTDMKMDYHFKNALRDAFLYGWDSEILRSIFSGIENAYLKKKREIWDEKN